MWPVNLPCTAPKYLSALFDSGSLTGQGDHELLDRFASRRDQNDEAAELAFGTLLARHGAMVMRVCRAVLGDRHEAEDAFQATFLVLASRAGSIRRRGSVAAWLHGVALRVSAAARSRAARRRRHEGRRAEMTTHTSKEEGESPAPEQDLGRVLQEEIDRLPDPFRAAVVLCYLEGLTHEMAAFSLAVRSGRSGAGWRRRENGCAGDLARRGVAPAALPMGLAGSGLMLGSESAGLPASIPAALASATVRGALRAGLGKGALAGIVSAEAFALMEEVLNTMMTTKLTLLTATVLCAGLVATGAGVAAYSALGPDEGRSGVANPAADNASETGTKPNGCPFADASACARPARC